MKLKKFITLAMTVAMVLSFSSMASAAEGNLSVAEKNLIENVKKGYTAGDCKITFTADQITALENYLASNDVSDDKIKEVESNIDAAVAIIKEAGVKDVSQLTKAQKDKVVAKVVDAGTAAGVKVVVGTDSIKVTAADGTALYTANVDLGNKKTNTTTNTNTNTGSTQNTTTNNNVIKKTGFGLEASVAVVTLLAVTVVSCAIVSKRRNFAA